LPKPVRTARADTTMALLLFPDCIGDRTIKLSELYSASHPGPAPPCPWIAVSP
jgi:hypothetical protein